MLVTRNQPLSEQVRVQILEWIQSDRPDLADNALPSEAGLAEIFATSRATIREALALLERDRIIIRRQGSGTYINPALRSLQGTITELVDPLHLIETHGYQAAIGPMETTEAAVGADTAETLHVPPESAAVHFRAVYLAGGRPVIRLVATIPLDELGPSARRAGEFAHLIQFASEVSGRTATHSIATIRAAAADVDVASCLNVAPGLPLLSLEELYLTDHGRPAFVSRMFLLSDVIELILLRNSYRLPERVSIW